MVFKVAHTYASGEADREDLAQEIVVQLWKAYPRYDPARPFSTWLYRIALNVGISHLRREGPRRRQTVPFDPDQHVPTAPDATATEPSQLLTRLIAELDPLSRALLVLYLDERSYREIGGILGISESNVSTKINRLKERLRRLGDSHGTR
jgi:RNA polymerase sigma factor, sigma-70 family